MLSEQLDDETIAQCELRFDVIVNPIGDPDTCPRSQSLAEDFAARTRLPVINRPEHVAPMTRDWLARNFLGIADLIVPPARRIKAARVQPEELAAAIDESGLRYPLLLRPAGSHTGRGLVKVERSDALQEALKTLIGRDVYATEFVDFRSRDGFYRKYRCFRIGHRIIQHHVSIGTHWLVNAAAREATNKVHDWAKNEEIRWIRDGRIYDGNHRPAALDFFIDAVKDSAGIDFFGVDFSILPDGRVIIFEANPCMRSYDVDWDRDYPQVREALSAMQAAFAKLIEAKTGRGGPFPP